MRASRLVSVALGTVLTAVGLVAVVSTTAGATAAGPCDSGARVDQDSAGRYDYVLCSQNPDRGQMEKHLWVSVSGHPFHHQSDAPNSGITSSFAVPSQQSVAIGSTGGDECMVLMSFDAGGTWEQVLGVEGGGYPDRVWFTSPSRGFVDCVSADGSTVYTTVDGGHNWISTDR